MGVQAKWGCLDLFLDLWTGFRVLIHSSGEQFPSPLGVGAGPFIHMGFLGGGSHCEAASAGSIQLAREEQKRSPTTCFSCHCHKPVVPAPSYKHQVSTPGVLRPSGELEGETESYGRTVTSLW